MPKYDNPKDEFSVLYNISEYLDDIKGNLSNIGNYSTESGVAGMDLTGDGEVLLVFNEGGNLTEIRDMYVSIGDGTGDGPSAGATITIRIDRYDEYADGWYQYGDEVSVVVGTDPELIPIGDIITRDRWRINIASDDAGDTDVDITYGLTRRVI